MICSDNRPVTVADVEALRARYRLRQMDLAVWLGCTLGDLAGYARLGQLRPGMLTHHSHALTVRWLDRYPDEARIGLGDVPPNSFHARLSRVLGPERPNWKSFALHLGRESSAGHRWSKGSPGSPAVHRACALLTRDNDAAQRDVWRRWRAIARLEARLRGVPDLDRVITWPSCRLPREPMLPPLDTGGREEHMRGPSRKERSTCAEYP